MKSDIGSEMGNRISESHQCIGPVIVVAGPSCVGKTTLIGKLRSGELQRLQNQLGMGDLDCWEYKDAWQLGQFSVSESTNLLVHYDIIRLMDENIRSYSCDPIFDVVLQNQQVVILTLLENPHTLLRRCRLRRRAIFRYLLKGRFLLFVKRLKRLNRRCRLYGDPKVLCDRLESWFDFCATLNCSEHYVAQSLNPEELQSLTDPLDVQRLPEWYEDTLRHPFLHLVTATGDRAFSAS